METVPSSPVIDRDAPRPSAGARTRTRGGPARRRRAPPSPGCPARRIRRRRRRPRPTGRPARRGRRVAGSSAGPTPPVPLPTARPSRPHRPRRASLRCGCASVTRLAYDGRAAGGEAGEQDGRLHLGARHRRGPVDPPEVPASYPQRGQLPLAAALHLRPHRASGSATRSMGRAESDSSPTSSVSQSEAGDQTGQQAHGRPRVAAVEGGRGGRAAGRDRRGRRRCRRRGARPERPSPRRRRATPPRPRRRRAR